MNSSKQIKTTIEDTLSHLVAMPTVTDDAAANEVALDYIESYLQDRGMFTKRFVFDGHGSLVATVHPDDKQPKVLLYAHVDVMEGGKELFTLQKQGDKLIGRGTYDMKFAIAAYMQLIDDIQDSLQDYDLGIMIVSDEEYGGRDNINGARQLINAGYAPEVCIMPDGGSDWNIETLAKGHWRFDLIASGKTAHSSRPWEGESASFKLIHALHELKLHFNDHGPLTDTLNISAIQGGATYNQIPDAMQAGIEIRLTNEGSLAKNQALVDAICQKYGLTLRKRAHKAPLRTDITHPLVAGFADSVGRVTGKQIQGCISYAASDAMYFDAIGTPCILSRPTGGNHHGPGEWISCQSLAEFVPILKDYLMHTAYTAPVSVDKAAVLV